MSEISTVADFSKRWMVLCPRPTRATSEHNDSMLKRWTADFGDRALDAGITPLEAQEWCLADPRNRSSARYIRAFYNDAMKLGLASCNPISDMALSLKPSKGRREVDPPTLDAVRAIADATIDKRFRAAILTSVATGIRQAELCALDTSMVQRVPFTTIRLPARIVKGQQHPRVLTFAPEVADAERAFLDILPADGPVFGFTTPEIRTRWNELRRVVGHEWTWHDLRHAAATWLLEAGKRPEDIALMLWGRRDTKLLLSLYAHEDREAAAARLRGAV